MSIREFHSRLTLTQEPDALMATLRRLSMVENPDVVIAAAAQAEGLWIFWTY
jgi:hypothetical protein